MARGRKSKKNKEQIQEVISEESKTLNVDIFDSMQQFINDNIYSKYIVSYKPEYISTGIKYLDEIIGGGFVTGLTSTLTSPPETGKSTISLQAAAQLLKQNPNSIVIYIDTENPGIKDQFGNFPAVTRLQYFGIDLSNPKYRKRFIYLPGIKIVGDIYRTVKEILEFKKTLEEEHELSNPIPTLVIIDSIADAIPDQFLEYGLETGEVLKQKGIKASTVQEYMSLLTYLAERSNTGIILLDQVRSNIQINPRGASSKQTVQHKDLKTATSAKAIEHKTRQWLFLEKGEEIIHKYPGINGWILKISMDKSKLTGSTGMTVEVVFDKIEGLNSFWSHYHFLSNRMPYEQKFLSKQEVPSKIRKFYEENAPLAIQRNKISYPGIEAEYSFRSKLDIIKEYNKNEEFRNFFEKVLFKSIEDRVKAWLNPNSELNKIAKQIGIIIEEENKEISEN